MLHKDRLEMLCDLIALQRAGYKPIKEWYAARKDRINLHPETRVWLEAEIAKL